MWICVSRNNLLLEGAKNSAKIVIIFASEKASLDGEEDIGGSPNRPNSDPTANRNMSHLSKGGMPRPLWLGTDIPGPPKLASGYQRPSPSL
jgi:hypothetical protein